MELLEVQSCIVLVYMGKDHPRSQGFSAALRCHKAAEKPWRMNKDKVQ
jgi:hypothetical protein